MKTYACPSGDFTCPYHDANGNCMMYPDANPWEECDDAAYYHDWDTDEEEDE